ncbi:hypothetical protein F4561_004944 [Lipingzhangella halophila]|uniref:SDR family oxidoreductase n=1 Tax=Lipingzhangella halophila TaxID=1783352 RepID=A0A7W7W5R3_9ACTN|nr:hypothetical protein [Lipingzhangella halophila]
MGRLHPLGRGGHVEEVAAATSYLLSNEASFINGAVLPVDGGRSVLGRAPEERPASSPRPLALLATECAARTRPGERRSAWPSAKPERRSSPRQQPC